MFIRASQAIVRSRSHRGGGAIFTQNPTAAFTPACTRALSTANTGAVSPGIDTDPYSTWGGNCHAPALPANHPGPMWLRASRGALISVAQAFNMQSYLMKRSFSDKRPLVRGIKDYREYQLDGNDIVVTTNMKCGTNVLLQAMFQLAWLGEGEYRMPVLWCKSCFSSRGLAKMRAVSPFSVYIASSMFKVKASL